MRASRTGQKREHEDEQRMGNARVLMDFPPDIADIDANMHMCKPGESFPDITGTFWLESTAQLGPGIPAPNGDHPLVTPAPVLAEIPILNQGSGDSGHEGFHPGHKETLKEKNRKAQARFRDNQRLKKNNLQSQVEALERQLASVALETSMFKQENEVLHKVLNARQTQVDILTESSRPAAIGEVPAASTTAPSFGMSASYPKLTIEQIRAMTPRDAAIAWRDFVQHMSLLLVAVEVPSPTQAALDALSDIHRAVVRFAQTMAVVNPDASKGMKTTNLETLVADLDGYLARNETWWKSKVEGMLLQQDQVDKLHVLARRHSRTTDALQAERGRLHKELDAVLPQTLHVYCDNASAEASIRSVELVKLLSKNMQGIREAWGAFAVTIFGQLLTPIQVVRFCVSAYPYSPDAHMITRCMPPPSAPLPPLASEQGIRSS